jgi:hypothetical protein
MLRSESGRVVGLDLPEALETKELENVGWPGGFVGAGGGSTLTKGGFHKRGTSSGTDCQRVPRTILLTIIWDTP